LKGENRHQRGVITALKEKVRELRCDLFSKTDIGRKIESLSLSCPESWKFSQKKRPLLTVAEWEEFTCEFDSIYDHFTNRLRNSYPMETKEDLRLCCLLILKRNNSDIAMILDMDTKSVHKKKSRLKIKKLGLDHPVDLYEFLMDFCE
jgi:hypothetical protein